ncbi:unnamed protein product [Mucor hiemalis]
MVIQKLPLEIIQKVFEYIDLKELYQYLYICKRWHLLIKSTYYRDITWSSKEKIEWLKGKLSTTNEKDDTFHILPMTKQLHIYFDVDYESEYINNEYSSPNTRLTETEFLFLLSLFPNLEHLDIMQSVHRDHYMKILCNCRDRELLPQLEEVVMGNSTDGNENQELCRLEFALCYQFRYSLKHMKITYISSLAGGSSFLDSLPDFKKLTTLEVCNDSDPDLTLFHLLQACPNLSSLAYRSSLSVPTNATQQLENMLYDLKRQKLSISHFLKHLKTVKLSIPTLTTSYIEFFANHSPKSLNKVEFIFTRSDLYSWIETTSMNLALNFCETLQKLGSVRLSFESTERVVDAEARRIMQRPDSKINIFYLILGALTKGRALNNYTAIYNNRKGEHVDINIFNDSSIIYQYHLDHEDYKVPPPVSVDYSFGGPSYQDCTLPVPSSLESLASLRNFMVLTGPGEFDRLPKNYLEFVKNYCPKLKHFEIKYRRWKCRFKAACRDPLKVSLENTTHILMEGAQFTQGLFDSLIEYFPRVESLSFGIDTALDLYNEKIKFKLSNFKHLHTFIIDVEGLSGFKCDPIFLQFQYTGSDRTVQYQIKKKSKLSQDGCGYDFEPISASFMQEGIDEDEIRRTYVIYVEGLPQLAKIELKEFDAPYASLDLSYILFNDLSLETK